MAEAFQMQQLTERLNAAEAALGAAAATAQTQQAQLQQQQTQIEALLQQQQAGGGKGKGGGAPGAQRRLGLDTRMLGKPDIYDGDAQKWPDWITVIRAYTAIAIEGAGGLMEQCEADPESEILRATLLDEGQQHYLQRHKGSWAHRVERSVCFRSSHVPEFGFAPR